MTFAELDWTAAALRALVYAATIAVAGGALVWATLDMRPVHRAIRLQIVSGAVLVFVCEPLRYVAFQLSIAQGDWSMAFDPAMRWIGLETPLGQAALVRLIGTIAVLAGLAWRPIAVAGALIIVASYLLEGHTASSDSRIVVALLLFLHLLVVHWWIGALLPLRATLAIANNRTAASSVDRFGQLAVAAVAILVVAGGLMLALLTNGHVDLNQPYQQGFAVKLFAFLVILLIAAVNKLRWTPMLLTEPDKGRSGLRAWLTLELFVAAGILAATAVALSFPPSEH